MDALQQEAHTCKYTSWLSSDEPDPRLSIRLNKTDNKKKNWAVLLEIFEGTVH